MASRSIRDVFDVLRQHLRANLNQLECFGKYEFQAESWLKAEWVAILDDLETQGQIYDLDREVKSKGQKRIDLAVDRHGGRHWIELKHWYLGKQKDNLWRPVDFIFELEAECKKFEEVQAGDRAWIAALCTTNPGSSDWSNAIQQFNEENAPWELRSIDDPEQYPPTYFLGVLHVQGIDA